MPPVTNANAQGRSVLFDLGDAGSFANEAALAANRVFGIEVTNNTGIAKDVVLIPAYFGTDPSLVVRDGVISTGLSARSTNGRKTIQQFLLQVQHDPMHLQKMQVESSTTSQLNQTIITQTKDIFRNEDPTELVIGSFKKTSNLNDKFLEITNPYWILDKYTEMRCTIPGQGTTEDPIAVVTTFLMYFGATFNQGMVLYQGMLAAGVK